MKTLKHKCLMHIKRRQGGNVGKIALTCHNIAKSKRGSEDGSNDESINMYLNGLLVRLRDRGVSVRKSVANTLREILLHHPDHPRYTELCRCLLERCWLPKEETTLKDTIQNTFQQLWFSPPPPAALQYTCIKREGGSSSSVGGAPDDGISTSMNDSTKKSLSTRNQLTPAHVYSSSISSKVVDVDVNSVIGGSGGRGVGPVSLGPSPKTPSSSNTGVSVITSMTPSSSRQGGLGSIRTPSSPAVHLHTEVTAAQIVDVLASGPTQQTTENSDGEEAWLVRMLRGMLHDGRGDTVGGSSTFSERQVRSRRESARRHCEQIVECLMELLIQTEEALHGIQGGTESVATAVPAREGRRCYTDQIVAIFVTLSAFCEAHPPYVVRHLHTLLPYLRGDNRLSQKQEGKVCLKLVNMLSQGFVCQFSSSSSSSSSLSGDINQYSPKQPQESQVSFASSIQHAAWISQSNDIAQDLTRIALKYGTASIIEASISCLALLCQHVTHSPDPLHTLAKKCFTAIATVASEIHQQHLLSTAENPRNHSSGQLLNTPDLPGSLGFYASTTSSQLARLQRCIVVLGYICEQTSHCPILNCSQEDRILDSSGSVRFTSHEEDLLVAKCSLVALDTFDSTCPYVPGLSGVTAEALQQFPVWSLNGACFVCAFFMLHVDSAVVQARAVQALCSVFVGNPKLMMYAESKGLISHLLKYSSTVKSQNDFEKDGVFGDNVHEKLLLSLQHVMVMEEKRLERQAALDQMRQTGTTCVTSAHIKGEAEFSADASITGSILQQHSSLLLQFLCHANPRLRCASLDLIGTLLSHGMVHPLDVIAWLIGLQGDPEETIRKSALHLLQVEDERHSSFFDNRLMDGVEMAYTIQRTRAPDHPVVSKWFMSDGDDGLDNTVDAKHGKGRVVSIFAPLYKTCIQPHRKRRADFVTGVLRRCDSAIQDIAQVLEADTHHVGSYLMSACRHVELSVQTQTKSQKELLKVVNGEEKESVEEEQRRVSQDELAAQRSKKRSHLAASLSEGLGAAAAGKGSGAKNSRRKKPTRKFGGRKGGGVASERGEEGQLELLAGVVKNSVHLVSFLASSIASIPFDTCDEPLFLTYWITRHLSMEMDNHNKCMRTCLRILGCVESTVEEQSVPMTTLVNKECELSLPIDVTKGGDHISKEGLSYEMTKVKPAIKNWLAASSIYGREQNNSAAACGDDISSQSLRAGASLMSLSFGSLAREVLLRLKEYMKVAYNLSDERCAAYCPQSSSSLTTSTQVGMGSNVGPNAGEDGIPLGREFEPFPNFSPADNSVVLSDSVLPLFNKSLVRPTVIVPLWQIIHAAANDYNRLYNLLTNGDCDLNISTSTIKRSRPSARKPNRSSAAKTKAAKTKGAAAPKKKRKSLLMKRHRRSSLGSISEGGDDEESDPGHSDDDDEYQSNSLLRSESTASVTSGGAMSPGGRTSGRKRRRTCKLGNFAENGGVGVDIVSNL